jgi:hypothetical protein
MAHPTIYQTPIQEAIAVLQLPHSSSSSEFLSEFPLRGSLGFVGEAIITAYPGSAKREIEG